MNLNSIQAVAKQFCFVINFLAAFLMVTPAVAQNPDNSKEHLTQKLAQSSTFSSFLDVMDSLKMYYHSNLKVSFAQRTWQEQSEFLLQLQSVSDATKIDQALGQVFLDPNEFLSFTKRFETIKARLLIEFPRLFQLTRPEVENILKSILVNRPESTVSPVSIISNANKILETRAECLARCSNQLQASQAACEDAAAFDRAVCAVEAASASLDCRSLSPPIAVICLALVAANELRCETQALNKQAKCSEDAGTAYDNCIAGCPPERTFYRDEDGDSYGDPEKRWIQLTPPPLGYVEDNTDCDDTNPSINPGQSELCGNAVDENCKDGTLECMTTVRLSPECEGDNILLKWETLSQMNVPRYEIERSKDGLNWEPVSLVVEPNNNVTSAIYSSRQPILGGVNNFYRVVGYALDGRKIFSEVVSPPCMSSSNIVISPNPIRETGLLTIISSKTTPVNLSVYNSMGKVVHKELLNVYVGNNQFQIDLRNLPSGVYAANIQGQGILKTIRIIKGSH